MEAYHDLFVASAGAAAAFIGLLFVAISISPDTIVGSNANDRRRAQAQRAFLALVNIFFVSLVALIPKVESIALTLVALVTIAQVLATVVRMSRRSGLTAWRQLGFISLGVYVLEIFMALRIETHPVGIVEVVLGLYAYALLTAWDLLKAKEQGVEVEL